MDKLRLRLLMCLIIIFTLTSIAFLAIIFGSDTGTADEDITGAVVTDDGGPLKLGAVIPVIFFIGFLILTVFYLEKK